MNKKINEDSPYSLTSFLLYGTKPFVYEPDLLFAGLIF